MTSNVFQTKLIARLLLIILLGWLSAVLLISYNLLLFIWPVILAIIFIIELFIFLNKEKKEVYYFLLALSENIFADSVIGKQCSPQIQQAGEDLRKKVKDLSEQKKMNHIFLEHVADHVDSGLICYDDKHHVRFINKQAKKILNRNAILNIDNLQYRYQSIHSALSAPEKHLNKIVEFTNNGSVFCLLIRSVQFSINDHPYTLVSLKDIKEQLDKQEVDAWRNLVRYLSHEILNSVIPIANLSDYVKDNLTKCNDSPEMVEMADCLDTVSSRSKALVGIVNSARQLSRLPTPTLRSFKVASLFKRVLNLLHAKIEKRHITIHSEILHSHLMLKADIDLIEQVLINLLNNGMDALSETDNPNIRLVSGLAKGENVFIAVQDNGPGIPKDKMDKIFIPFFTTKKNGTGIGLSLSRQIMALHKGTLNVKSQPGKTVFIMDFKSM